MIDKKLIKEGDLVTVTLGPYQVVSNTYLVAKKLEAESLLSHPLAPDLYILKKDDELNNAFPSMQNPVEKCLYYAKKHRDILGFTMASDLDALCYYFVIKKDFSPKQRADLASICGKIASAVLNGNVSSAIVTIKQNKVLLDEFNYSLLNNIKSILDNPLSIQTKSERFMVFNIAGFALAQLHT